MTLKNNFGRMSKNFITISEDFTFPKMVEDFYSMKSMESCMNMIFTMIKLSLS